MSDDKDEIIGEEIIIEYHISLLSGNHPRRGRIYRSVN